MVQGLVPLVPELTATHGLAYRSQAMVMQRCTGRMITL